MKWDEQEGSYYPEIVAKGRGRTCRKEEITVNTAVMIAGIVGGHLESALHRSKGNAIGEW